ncbi:MAG: histidine phosphatase family protein, partial [Bifidobacteriaceae bacterium]|nr:histidine phosphatase family protein [Bifidobacteriaceae bacterium]
MRLLLIRHGRIVSNDLNMLDTRLPGPPLNERGQAQAAALAQRLALVSIDAVFSSPARRAVETAQPLARALGLDITELPGLKELSAGDLEGQCTDGDQLDYAKMAYQWMTASGPDYGRLPGGETRDGFLARMDQAIAQVAAALGEPRRGTEGPASGAPLSGTGAAASGTVPGGRPATASPAVLTAAVVSHGGAIGTWVSIRARGGGKVASRLFHGVLPNTG